MSLSEVANFLGQCTRSFFLVRTVEEELVVSQHTVGGVGGNKMLLHSQ